MVHASKDEQGPILLKVLRSACTGSVFSIPLAGTANYIQLSALQRLPLYSSLMRFSERMMH